MLDIYTVAFFGHRYIDNPLKVEELLEEQIRKLINEKEYVDFIVGRNGEFDQCVSSTVLRARKNVRDDNSALILMLPYVSSAYVYNDMLYAFSSSQDIGAQSTIHCINPSTMVEEKQIDITALGCDVRTVVGVGDILYFVVCSDSNGDFNNIVGAFNTATGEVSTIEFQKNVFHLLNVDNKLYVSHGNLVTCEGTALSVYDIATTDITTYDLGVWIGQIAVNGESLYVMGQHQIAKYDLHTLEKQAEKQIALNSGYYLSGIFANLLNADR